MCLHQPRHTIVTTWNSEQKNLRNRWMLPGIGFGVETMCLRLQENVIYPLCYAQSCPYKIIVLYIKMNHWQYRINSAYVQDRNVNWSISFAKFSSLVSKAPAQQNIVCAMTHLTIHPMLRSARQTRIIIYSTKSVGISITIHICITIVSVTKVCPPVMLTSTSTYMHVHVLQVNLLITMFEFLVIFSVGLNFK